MLVAPSVTLEWPNQSQANGAQDASSRPAMDEGRPHRCHRWATRAPATEGTIGPSTLGEDAMHGGSSSTGPGWIPSWASSARWSSRAGLMACCVTPVGFCSTQSFPNSDETISDLVHVTVEVQGCPMPRPPPPNSGSLEWNGGTRLAQDGGVSRLKNPSPLSQTASVRYGQRGSSHHLD